MAGPYEPIVKGVAWQTAVVLVDLSSPGSYRVNPTLAVGDAKVDKDGAGFSNLTTLPTVTPAGGRRVAVSLSAAEMNADIVTLQLVDETSPKEWGDLILTITTVAAKQAVTLAAADVSGNLPANVKAVNSVTVQGAGTPSNPWGP